MAEVPIKILLVDDEPNIHYSFSKILPESYALISATNGTEGIEMLKTEAPHVVVMDIKMPGISGLEALKKMREIDARVPIVMMTAFGTIDTAISAMKSGAFEYLLKPFDLEKMRTIIKKAVDSSVLMRRTVVVPSDTEPRGDLPEGDNIVGSSEAMQEVYKLIGQVAEQDVTVLIRGESGTGKELVARAIYQHSRRAERPFLEINCAALPDNLLESELFGHEKGAFTGAHSRHIGKFEQVDGGTLFLDEIGEMSLMTQAKVLRVIQHGEYSRLGGKENLHTNVRLIAATHVDLERAIKQGTFREDLYYRLNIITISLPPLRERNGDIKELVDYFIRRYAIESGKNIQGLEQTAMERIISFGWPGNVRELENCIRRAVVLAKGALISKDDIELEGKSAKAIRMASSDEELLEQIIERIMAKSNAIILWPFVEKLLVEKTLQKTNGNQVKAAKILGIHRNTLRNRVERYDLAHLLNNKE